MNTATAVVTAAITLAWPIVVALPAFGVDRGQPDDLAPTALALRSVPPAYLNWYQQAARTCSGLSWPVLAGIGELESGHGQSSAPGVHGAANYAGAQGPMQFEPATFATYAVRADTRHPLSVYNAQDAIFSAAKMLCANGAATGTPEGLRSALLAYNNAGWYPPAVLGWASRYGTIATKAPAPAPRAPAPQANVPPSAAPPSAAPKAPAPPSKPTDTSTPSGHLQGPVHKAAPKPTAVRVTAVPSPKPGTVAPVTTAPGTGARAATAPKHSTTPVVQGPAPVSSAALSAEADSLSAQARQLASEAARLSALARQLAAGGLQLSAGPAAAAATPPSTPPRSAEAIPSTSTEAAPQASTQPAPSASTDPAASEPTSTVPAASAAASSASASSASSPIEGVNGTSTPTTPHCQSAQTGQRR